MIGRRSKRRRAAEARAAEERQRAAEERARARAERARQAREQAHCEAPVEHARLRRGLVLGGVAIVLASATTLAFASRRIADEQAAFAAPSAGGRCVPTTLNRSAVLPGASP